MYCIIVKNVLHPGMRDAYLTAMHANAEASVRDEPDCYRFDVLEAREEKNTFYLYEIYTSPDALEVHKKTPHYTQSRKALADCIAETNVIRADVLAQNPNP